MFPLRIVTGSVASETDIKIQVYFATLCFTQDVLRASRMDGKRVNMQRNNRVRYVQEKVVVPTLEYGTDTEDIIEMQPIQCQRCHETSQKTICMLDIIHQRCKKATWNTRTITT